MLWYYVITRNVYRNFKINERRITMSKVSTKNIINCSYDCKWSQPVCDYSLANFKI